MYVALTLEQWHWPLGPWSWGLVRVWYSAWVFDLGSWDSRGAGEREKKRDTSSSYTDCLISCVIITLEAGDTPASPKGLLFPKLDTAFQSHWLVLPTVGH